jgi:acyl-CoA dehydrogenase
MFMELALTSVQRAFQEEVRDFLASRLPEGLRNAQRGLTSTFNSPEISRAWLRILAEKGWAAPLWPPENGGPGWSPITRLIFETECARADAPVINPQGIRYVGPLLLRYGSDRQCATFLPKIISGEHFWCQGYSEPGAGSDLAALATRAVIDGDHYIVNGSKIWTTDAQHADWMFALVRTNVEGRKQEGISLLLIDMRSPGLSLRPIISINGVHELNQIFLDDVRVPIENRVGEEDKGWSYGKYLLEFERGGSFVAARIRRLVEQIETLIGPPPHAFESRIAELQIEIEIVAMMELKLATDLSQGGSPGSFASILKLRSSLLRQAVTRLGVDATPDAAALKWSPAAVPGASWPDENDPRSFVSRHLTFRAWTIFAGATEVQREIIAKTLIG